MAKRIDFPLSPESGPWTGIPWVQDFISPGEAPIDGLTIVFTVRQKGGGAIVAQVNATLQDSATRTFRVNLNKATMIGVPPGEYDYSNEITTSGQEDLLGLGRWGVKAVASPT